MYRLGNGGKIGIHSSWVDQYRRLHAASIKIQILAPGANICYVKRKTTLLFSSVLPGGRRGGAPGEHQGLRIPAGSRLRELHPRVGLRGREVPLPLQPGER